jgi:hypothetical protein
MKNGLSHSTTCRRYLASIRIVIKHSLLINELQGTVHALVGSLESTLRKKSTSRNMMLITSTIKDRYLVGVSFKLF